MNQGDTFYKCRYSLQTLKSFLAGRLSWPLMWSLVPLNSYRTQLRANTKYMLIYYIYRLSRIVVLFFTLMSLIMVSVKPLPSCSWPLMWSLVMLNTDDTQFRANTRYLLNTSGHSCGSLSCSILIARNLEQTLDTY